MRTTDQIVADVCAALSVESVEIRRPARIVECTVCGSEFVNGSCPMTCDVCGEHEDVPHTACDAAASAPLGTAQPQQRPAPQLVRTAPFSYYGNDRLDVSPRSPDPIGGWFAPSSEIASMMQCAQQSKNKGLVAGAWEALQQDYTAEMRVSFGLVPGSEYWTSITADEQRDIYAALARGVEPAPAAWESLRAMRDVTLVCRCEDAARCHRVLLARILEKLGATYAGEVR